MTKEDEGKIGVLLFHMKRKMMYVLDQEIRATALCGKAAILGRFGGAAVTEVVVTEYEKSKGRQIFCKRHVAQEILTHAVRDLHHCARIFRDDTVCRKIGFLICRSDREAFHGKSSFFDQNCAVSLSVGTSISSRVARFLMRTTPFASSFPPMMTT